jgi:hypothetical protein
MISRRRPSAVTLFYRWLPDLVHLPLGTLAANGLRGLLAVKWLAPEDPSHPAHRDQNIRARRIFN